LCISWIGLRRRRVSCPGNDKHRVLQPVRKGRRGECKIDATYAKRNWFWSEQD